jgi:hypothetical protein
MRVIRGTATVCLLPLSASVAGCGGGERQDKNEPSGSFAVQVTRAAFPAKQTLSQSTRLAIAVKNTDSKPLPNVAVTINSFGRAANDTALADPRRPVWIVDEGPAGGETAYVSTWALGELAPGATRTFTWKVTAVQAGTQTVKYKVSPGLNGKARAEDAGATSGSFTVAISREPAQARVDPETGAVIRGTGASAQP